MVIREAGLLFRGFNLVNSTYHQTSGDEIDKDLRSGLLTAILNFAENAFSNDLLEYFEGKKFVIAFTQDTIVSLDSAGKEGELLIAYAILDKEKKIDKHVHKVIQPQLREIIREFKKEYEGTVLSEISRLKVFRNILDEIFGSDTKTIDQKLKGTFF